MKTVVRLIVLVILIASSVLFPLPSAVAAAPSVTDARYFAGVNVPWYNWGCDFGCGSTKGVSDPRVRAALAGEFAQLQAADVHAVRWFVFLGGAWQINRGADGGPSDINPTVYEDLDAALSLAAQYDLAIDLVLFGGPPGIPAEWLTEPPMRQRLADSLTPMFERYSGHPRILAWDLFNEPEWRIEAGEIPAEAFQQTIRLLTDTVHARSSTPVTSGSATMAGLQWWSGLGLDYLSVHWYDTMTSPATCALCTDVPALAARYGTGSTPIVLGEFQAGPNIDALQRFIDLRQKGFAGAWAWSLFDERTHDDFQVDLQAITAFTQLQSGQPAG